MSHFTQRGCEDEAQAVACVFRKRARRHVETQHVFCGAPLFKLFDGVETIPSSPRRPLLSSRRWMCCLATLASHPRLRGPCCTRVYRWQASNSCCDRDQPRVISLPMADGCRMADKSFIGVENVSGFHFCVAVSSCTAAPPSSVCLRPFSYFLQTFGLGLHPLVANVSSYKLEAFVFLCIFEPCQRESLILLCVVSLFYEFILFIKYLNVTQHDIFSAGFSSTINIQTLHCSVFFKLILVTE